MEITLYKNEHYELKGDFFPSKNEHKAGIIVYFHGGGLIFGTKNDLPREYIDEITNNFDLLSVNYRLIPESNIDDIFTDLDHIYHYVKKQYGSDIYVMGRSAGGYLSYIFSRDYDIKGAFILYGYYDFKHRDFNQLPKDQVKFSPMLTQSIEKQNVTNKIVTELNPNPRFLLYLYYRNEALWQEKMNVDINNGKYLLTDNDLKNMPKTFLVHATDDPDVPYIYSKHASNLIPTSKLVTLNEEIHDFDKEVTEGSLDIYKEAMSFLKQN